MQKKKNTQRNLQREYEATPHMTNDPSMFYRNIFGNIKQ